MAGISIEGLTKRFAESAAQLAAVDNLSLDIASGELVTLLGPSGCGKTTTLRLIAGFLDPDKGRVAVDVEVISSPDRVVPPESRGLGMVFQNYAVWPHKTVFENVAFGLTLRKLPPQELRRKVADALALVNMTGLEARYSGEL